MAKQKQGSGGNRPDPYGRDPRLMTDFRAFLWLFWQHLDLPKPTARQLEIASFLQTCDNRFRVVEAFRGIGKSYITVAYALWRLYRQPETFRVMVVSANEQGALDFTKFIYDAIQSWSVVAFLRPKPTQRQSALSFDVGPHRADKQPSVTARGITGQLQGPRADLIIADDVEAKKNADTVGKRMTLASQIEEFAAILVPEGDPEIVFLGTPQTDASIYAGLPEKGYTVRIWPAKYPDEDYLRYHGVRVAPSIAEAVRQKPELEGHTTEPQRFSNEDLESRRLQYGNSGFALQFMLDTRIVDDLRFPLRLSDLIVMPLDFDEGPEKAIWAASPETELTDLPNYGKDSDRFYGPASIKDTGWAPYAAKVLVIDPAGRGADETAWGVFGFLYGQIFLLEIGADQRGYSDEVIQNIAQCAKKHRVHKVIYEANFGDGMAAQVMKPVFNNIYPVTIEEVKHYGVMKENRIIDTLEPVMNRHKLVVNRQVVEQDSRMIQGYAVETQTAYSLMFQMSRVAREKGCLDHDDRLDMVAMGVAHFLQQIDQDTDRAIQRQHDEELEKEIRKMEESAGLHRAPTEGYGVGDDPLCSGGVGGDLLD